MAESKHLWWPERHFMPAQELLPLLKNHLKLGEIAKASNIPFTGTTYRIAVVGVRSVHRSDVESSSHLLRPGDSFAGKSAFLNTANASWNQTRQWERFPEGQPSIPGTCRFDGPHLLHQSDGRCEDRSFLSCSKHHLSWPSLFDR